MCNYEGRQWGVVLFHEVLQYSSAIQVNHLSPFLLTLELLPILKESAPDSRVVFVASSAHKNGVLDPSNLQAERSYGRMKFYQNSKLFNVSFAIICFYVTGNALSNSVHTTG